MIPRPREEGNRREAYLVLTERAVPYLLARVRWPDVAQAITVGRPYWLDDPGLFDLPYSSSAVTLSFEQAASVAASWRVPLLAEAAQDVPSFIRRMPPNWSDLSPAERRTYGIESIGRQRASARQVLRLRAYRTDVVAAPAAGGSSGTVAEADFAFGPEGPAYGAILAPDVTEVIDGAPTERRRHARVEVDGRAYIRSGPVTFTANLVDVSEGGLRYVQPEAQLALPPGAMFDGPFLLEAKGIKSRICLNVPGQIVWRGSVGLRTHFGVAFGELTDDESAGLESFLAAACSKRGSR